MSVNAGHESEPDSPADGFCDFTLVDWSKTSFIAVFDASHRRHIFRHDREVLSQHSQLASHSISKVPYNEVHLSRGEAYLVEIKGILVYGVKSIRRRAVAHLPLPHLGRTKVMRCIDISCPPLPSLKSFQCPALSLLLLFLSYSGAVLECRATVVWFGTYFGTSVNDSVQDAGFRSEVRYTPGRSSSTLEVRDGVCVCRIPPACRQGPGVGAERARW